MEHSALHGLQLIGLIIALGGPWFVLIFLEPALRGAGMPEDTEFAGKILYQNATRWVTYGAGIAALAGICDLLVQTAELQGKTVFAGIAPSLAWQFSTRTAVGRFCLVKIGLLAAAAVVVRRAKAGRWWLTGGLVLGAVLATSLVSHAAAQPAGRGWAVAGQVAHLCGAAAWLGVLWHIGSAQRQLMAAETSSEFSLIAAIVRRFSPWALTAIAALSVSGMLAGVRFLGHAGALITSAYGLTLVIKLVLLQVAFFAGLMNHRLIRPEFISLGQQRDAFESESERKTKALARGSLLKSFNRYLELELAAGLLVITVAGIVGSVSPPGELGRQQLTSQQVSALLQPHLPRTTWPDPATFCGARDRTSGDLLYSEFMHNWSGVAVLLLGCCWLIESQGGRWATWAGRAWPCLLVPLGIFIAYASDPEVWLLRTMSFYEVLRDPQTLEHQLGALLVFVLAWLAWRNAGRSEIQRPLGYALPVIMMGGGLLLLGHAHSTLNTGDELTGLINVQHAILGGLGLLSGTVRWWSMRRLIPTRAAAWLWPGFVIALGVFMAFFYREAV